MRQDETGNVVFLALPGRASGIPWHPPDTYEAENPSGSGGSMSIRKTPLAASSLSSRRFILLAAWLKEPYCRVPKPLLAVNVKPPS